MPRSTLVTRSMAPHRYLSSTRNRHIRQALRLRKAAHRKEQGHTLIEGQPEIQRAMARQVPFHSIYICRAHIREHATRQLVDRLQAYAQHSGARIFEVSPHVFETLAVRSGTGAVVVEARPVQSRLRDLSPAVSAPYVVLEDADRPGNIGAVLRTVHAAGAAGLILARSQGQGTDLDNPGVIRASLGTVFDVPTTQADSAAVVKWLQRQERALIAITPEGRSLYETEDWPSRTAFVFGSEARGLTATWRQAAHAQVAIPMIGSAVDSLNLSVSVAVVLYEHLRRQTCG